MEIRSQIKLEYDTAIVGLVRDSGAKAFAGTGWRMATVCASHSLRVALRPWLVATFIFVFFLVSVRFNFPSFRLENPSKWQSLGEKESCSAVSPKLVGWTNISTLLEGNQEAEQLLRESGVESGGRYEPEECQSKHKVAIVVPYRNRSQHLPVFLRYLHPFLQRQQLSYSIIVVEQSNGSPFNRGMLLNIGFKEALLLQDQFECFIFHDVDFLPEDDGNPYSCPEDGKPRQMAFSIDYWDNYRPVPINFFGGVSAISTRDFQRINGYSNSFWGWGGEDDQLYQRILFNNLTVTRAFAGQPSLVHRARYKTLSHKKAEPNPDRKKVLQEGSLRFQTDGLANLQYQRLDLQLKPLYTHLFVDIQQQQ